MSYESDAEEISKFCSAFPNSNTSIELRRGLENGLPLIRAQVVSGPTKGANGKIVGFELPEWLKVHLAAIRARNLNADEIESGVRHNEAPLNV